MVWAAAVWEAAVWEIVSVMGEVETVILWVMVMEVVGCCCREALPLRLRREAMVASKMAYVCEMAWVEEELETGAAAGVKSMADYCCWEASRWPLQHEATAWVTA